MDRIIRKAEEQHSDHLNMVKVPENNERATFDAISRAACVIANEIEAKAIVIITHSGYSAMNTAKYRPNSHIIAVTGREKILRRLNIIWGVRGIIIPDFVADTDSAFRRINEELRRRGYVESGDYVVYTAGIPLLSQGSTNSIKVEKVE
jgi:pyruvate kinase